MSKVVTLLREELVESHSSSSVPSSPASNLPVHRRLEQCTVLLGAGPAINRFHQMLCVGRSATTESRSASSRWAASHHRAVGIWRGAASRSSSLIRMARRPQRYAGRVPAAIQRRIVLTDTDMAWAASSRLR